MTEALGGERTRRTPSRRKVLCKCGSGFYREPPNDVCKECKQALANPLDTLPKQK